MSKRIVMERGAVSKIARSLGCTKEMVSKSLNYKKDTELAKKIRHVACTQYGGVELTW